MTTLLDVAKAWAATPEGAAVIAERRANPKPLGPPSPPWSHERAVWLRAGLYQQAANIAVLTVGGRLVVPVVVGLP